MKFGIVIFMKTAFSTELSERQKIRKKNFEENKAITRNRTSKVRNYWKEQFQRFQDHVEEKLDIECTKTSLASKGILFGLGFGQKGKPCEKVERVYEIASPDGKI